MSAARQIYACLIIALLGVGFLMAQSTGMTASRESFAPHVERHVAYLLAAIAAGIFAATRRPYFWRRISPWLFALTVGLLIATLVPGIGTRVNGAQRWLRAGPVSLQASEWAKLTVPLMLAWILDRRYAGWSRWRQVAAAALGVLIPCGLILPQPDLGTALFVLAAAGVTLFLAGLPLRWFVVLPLASVPAAAALITLRPYQLARIQGLLSAWRDLDSAPYQLKQSLTSLGVGGINGVGLGQGLQKLSFLPERHTDFVFAVIGEELGFVGTAGVLLCWIGLYLAGRRMLAHLDPHDFRHTVGLTLLLGLVAQAALNVGVVSAVLPPKGITHPLISYGGNSLIVSMTMLGIVSSLAGRPPAVVNSEPKHAPAAQQPPNAVEPHTMVGEAA